MLVVVVVLPNCPERPTSGELSDYAVVASDDKRALVGKHGSVTRAGLPPAGGGVKERVDTRAGVVGVDKVVDPVAHGSLGKTVASTAIGVVLHIKHTCHDISELPSNVCDFAHLGE
jgi:hypothetical protein